jgi:cytochrome c oxidase cbb3-type subunit III
VSDGSREAPPAGEPGADQITPAAAHDQLLDHEYDGIREYDNPLPRWWVWMWAGSFVFSVAYFFHYHVSGNGQSVAAAYEADLREARENEAKANLAQPISEESLGKLMSDAALMNDAQPLFALRCAPCHGDKAQGVIGPNLTDSAWIHGSGTLTDIFAVINDGVLAKGMPAWGRQLSPIELRKLAAFVGMQRGKSLPGKAAEGVVHQL